MWESAMDKPGHEATSSTWAATLASEMGEGSKILQKSHEKSSASKRFKFGGKTAIENGNDELFTSVVFKLARRSGMSIPLKRILQNKFPELWAKLERGGIQTASVRF
jgi:hypothetical protein